MKLTDQAIKNAIASGALVPPSTPIRRRFHWAQKLALIVVFAGLVCIGFAYGVFVP